MAYPRNPFPKYELHKPSGNACVRWAGNEVWLGNYGTSESLKEYARLCAEIGSMPTPPANRKQVTITEMMLGFREHAAVHYRARWYPHIGVPRVHAVDPSPVSNVRMCTRGRGLGPVPCNPLGAGPHAPAWNTASTCRHPVNAAAPAFQLK